mmetsp:Transcript_26895/g.59073  ORF Transcript_26895/g.59073 Transcript_26895/m.59073 type:complete len:225 (+) Transcript_26895:305-979(+)
MQPSRAASGTRPPERGAPLAPPNGSQLLFATTRGGRLRAITVSGSPELQQQPWRLPAIAWTAPSTQQVLGPTALSSHASMLTGRSGPRASLQSDVLREGQPSSALLSLWPPMMTKPRLGVPCREGQGCMTMPVQRGGLLCGRPRSGCARRRAPGELLGGQHLRPGGPPGQRPLPDAARQPPWRPAGSSPPRASDPSAQPSGPAHLARSPPTRRAARAPEPAWTP